MMMTIPLIKVLLFLDMVNIQIMSYYAIFNKAPDLTLWRLTRYNIDPGMIERQVTNFIGDS